MPIIRTATENDLPRILELYQQLSIPPLDKCDEQDPVLDSHKQAFADINALPGCEVIVAEEDGKVIGTSMLTIVPNLTHGGKPWIIVENVVVDKKYRRIGAGKLLMEYIRIKAMETGCYQIQLMSDKRRSEEAHKFYSAIGYNATAEGFRMYPD
ncbi:MAG: GNAT family N-acetyltransferase [Dehalococcoidales bacterium]|nr:MAG: GNAT family N-acetyltransferase [Dehalococcoidales bacterium]